MKDEGDLVGRSHLENATSLSFEDLFPDSHALLTMIARLQHQSVALKASQLHCKCKAVYLG